MSSEPAAGHITLGALWRDAAREIAYTAYAVSFDGPPIRQIDPAGLAMFGLFTGILATGFAAETRRRDFVQTWNLVAGVSFLQCLDPAGIAEVARMLRRWDVPERSVVVRKGRPGDCMYFIASGEVEVEAKTGPVRLKAGSFFGELALLGNGVRNATVRTILPTTLLILDLADFRAFTAHHPELARAVEAEAAQRLGSRIAHATDHAPGSTPSSDRSAASS